LCKTSESPRSTYRHSVAKASLRSAGSAQQKRACSLEQYRVGGSADYVVVEHAGLAHEFVLAVGRDVRGGPDAVVVAKYVVSSSTVKMRLISSVNNGTFSLQTELVSEARM
jgi:hypothetical protein